MRNGQNPEQLLHSVQLVLNSQTVEKSFNGNYVFFSPLARCIAPDSTPYRFALLLTLDFVNYNKNYPPDFAIPETVLEPHYPHPLIIMFVCIFLTFCLLQSSATARNNPIDKIVSIRSSQGSANRDKWYFETILADGSRGIIDRNIAKQQYTQQVIEFYQSKIEFYDASDAS